MYEAINAITSRYPRDRVDLRAGGGASIDAAVAAASRYVLLHEATAFSTGGGRGYRLLMSSHALRHGIPCAESPLSRFGGFLLLLASCLAHFTGATGMRRPENVDGAHPSGVLLKTPGNAGKVLLSDRLGSRTRMMSQSRRSAGGILGIAEQLARGATSPSSKPREVS